MTAFALNRGTAMRFGERMEALIGLVQLWRSRAAERRLLTMLSERDLKDIGVSRAEAQVEAEKPFWRA